MIQWIRNLLGLPDDQPCQLIPEETIMPEEILIRGLSESELVDVMGEE